MIEEEKVKHIADLARLNVSEKEMEKYQKQLGDILMEIEKIIEVDIDNEIMISPTTNENCFNDDVIENHISRQEAFKNAKRVKGDYLTVPKVVE